jgi:hypothetical protein
MQTRDEVSPSLAFLVSANESGEPCIIGPPARDSPRRSVPDTALTLNAPVRGLSAARQQPPRVAFPSQVDYFRRLNRTEASQPGTDFEYPFRCTGTGENQPDPAANARMELSSTNVQV